MAASAEMVAIALATLPNACCLVPERRAERTTEGGLNVVNPAAGLADHIRALKAAGIRVSLFIEPDLAAVEASTRLGADIVEFHTGRYCEHALAGDARGIGHEVARMTAAARQADACGLEVHAGHGLTFLTVAAVARIPEVVELNIGHFLMGEAMFTGIDAAIRHMCARMAEARP